VEFDPEVIHTTTINATRGVSHFNPLCIHPATVPSSVIHQLSIYQPEDITDPETPYPGDSVVITEGAFEGYRQSLLNLMAKRVQCCQAQPAQPADQAER
jgi:transcriptional antiterminator RfaH